MRIEGLHEIASRFDGMLIDQFGVIHDGQTLYPGTLRVLSELKAAGIPVTVMTNSGKRAEANRQRLVQAMSQFRQSAASAEVSLLCYSGHGVQVSDPRERALALDQLRRSGLLVPQGAQGLPHRQGG